ncbi:MAG: hypothetical protein GC178_13795 [Flavobacteriales bacterium]|nr:hypothetical protein [Flavobacteriales bacterium]
MLPLFSAGQELRLVKTIEGHYDYMTSDVLGRLYIARGHELFLYYPDGTMKYQFSDLSRGAITQLDTRNPMKLLLFYPTYSLIVFLDNTLSRSQPSVDLNTLQLELVQLACTSFDNGFWVYDPVSFRLLRYDQGLKVTNDVANVNQLVGAEINPNQMVEADSWVYMNDPDHGVFVFDSFGTYSKLIPIKGAERIQVRPNGIFFEFEDRLVKYDLLNFEQSEIELPVQEFESVSIEKNRLFVLQKDAVLVYELTK